MRKGGGREEEGKKTKKNHKAETEHVIAKYGNKMFDVLNLTGIGRNLSFGMMCNAVFVT